NEPDLDWRPTTITAPLGLRDRVNGRALPTRHRHPLMPSGREGASPGGRPLPRLDGPGRHPAWPGLTYRGAAVLYLNAAKARSIDADTRMRFDQYVYHSLQEYNRQRALRLAGKAANRNANLAEILRRLQENPSESDVTGGDALNIVLGELSDPRISPSSWR